MSKNITLTNGFKNFNSYHQMNRYSIVVLIEDLNKYVYLTIFEDSRYYKDIYINSKEKYFESYDINNVKEDDDSVKNINFMIEDSKGWLDYHGDYKNYENLYSLEQLKKENIGVFNRLYSVIDLIYKMVEDTDDSSFSISVNKSNNTIN